jgi:hypothetical protein
VRISRIIQSILLATFIFGAVIEGVWLFTGEHSPIAFTIGLSRLIRARERALLYETDHEVLAQVMRDFATERRWSSVSPLKTSSDEPLLIDGDDGSLPPALRLLKPSRIYLFDDHMELEFGGALLHFGIRVFPPGIPGQGTKRLGDGIWFYAENGQVPSQ